VVIPARDTAEVADEHAHVPVAHGLDEHGDVVEFLVVLVCVWGEVCGGVWEYVGNEEALEDLIVVWLGDGVGYDGHSEGVCEFLCVFECLFVFVVVTVHSRGVRLDWFWLAGWTGLYPRCIYRHFFFAGRSRASAGQSKASQRPGLRPGRAKYGPITGQLRASTGQYKSSRTGSVREQYRHKKNSLLNDMWFMKITTRTTSQSFTSASLPSCGPSRWSLR